MTAAPQTLLTEDQTAAFIREGFVKVKGLIPLGTVAETRAALATFLGLREGEPETWDGRGKTIGEAWRLTLPCWTPAIESAAHELVGPHIAHGPKVSPYLKTIGEDPWMEGYIPVLSYPDGGEPLFRPRPTPANYHVDGIDFVSHWPQELYLVVFVYLVDVKAFGGATVVLPGSHRKIFEHWCTHPEAATSKQVPDLEYAEPLPIEGEAGDVIFMHYLCAHTGSDNHDKHIRFGLNSSINVDPAHPYRRRRAAPAADWTPLDHTLRTDNIPNLVKTPST